MLHIKSAVCVLCFFFLTGYAAEVKVIARPTSVQDRVPFIKSNLVKIFTLKIRQWPTGEPLQVFVLPKDSLYTQVFVRDYLGMTPQAYFDMLAAGQASGRSSIPIELDTSAELIYRVMNTPDSIGYANETLLTNSNGRLLVISQSAGTR